MVLATADREAALLSCASVLKRLGVGNCKTAVGIGMLRQHLPSNVGALAWTRDDFSIAYHHKHATIGFLNVAHPHHVHRAAQAETLAGHCESGTPLPRAGASSQVTNPGFLV